MSSTSTSDDILAPLPDEPTEFPHPLPQIDALYDKELRVKRRLTAIEQEQEMFAVLDLEEQIKKYVADLQLEMDELMN
jgi:hypothetical protein